MQLDLIIATSRKPDFLSIGFLKRKNILFFLKIRWQVNKTIHKVTYTANCNISLTYITYYSITMAFQDQMSSFFFNQNFTVHLDAARNQSHSTLPDQIIIYAFKKFPYKKLAKKIHISHSFSVKNVLILLTDAFLSLYIFIKMQKIWKISLTAITTHSWILPAGNWQGTGMPTAIWPTLPKKLATYIFIVIISNHQNFSKF